MTVSLRTSDRRLLIRRCVACGYDGALLRGGQALRCARCGCDMVQRPARSYAEMEGLLGRPLAADSALDALEHRLHRSLQRWVAFLFISMLGLMGIIYLAAATFDV